MEGNMILAILVFCPFAGAIVSALIGRKNEIIRDYFADLVVVSEFLITLVIFCTNARSGNGLSYHDCYLPNI